MRVVLVNAEGADGVGLADLLRNSGVDCVSMRISAACLRGDQYTVWRMASGYPQSMPPEVSTARPPRGLLFELPDPPVEANAALAALRADRRFDGVPAVASFSIDHIDWLCRARAFDDFLLSPWSPIELIGRIDAAERRRLEARCEGAAQSVDAVSINASAREVTVNGCAVRLTMRECALFSYLWAQRGLVLSRHHLLERVWGQSYHGGPRTVDVHIRRLRSKLGWALPIDTVRGGGYRLIAAGGFDSGARLVAADGASQPASRRAS
jgi:DNA-binding winged helix-turn-helix (wHTH) protein